MLTKMKNGEENNNILNVELNSNNDPSDLNNVTQPNEVQNQVNVEKPKPVNIPYYIKVNNSANVVTVYKKDSKRKIYSTIQSYDMLNRHGNT